RPDVHLRPTFGGIADGFLWAALAWTIAVVIVAAWRSKRLGPWAPLVAAAIELVILYYAGTTQWGWSIVLPAQSPVLTELARQPSVGLIGGELQNLPVRAGLATGHPYLGFAQSNPNKSLVLAQMWLLAPDSSATGQMDSPALKRWFR